MRVVFEPGTDESYQGSTATSLVLIEVAEFIIDCDIYPEILAHPRTETFERMWKDCQKRRFQEFVLSVTQANVCSCLAFHSAGDRYLYYYVLKSQSILLRIRTSGEHVERKSKTVW